jgi:rubrerythrin
MLDSQQFKELLLQSLEHERGGVKVYEAALRCAISEELRHEWSRYLEQTNTHVQILEQVLQKLEIDADQPSPGRDFVRGLGEALVAALEKAEAAGNPTAAQLVACECVVLAETKDHQNWELLTKCAAHLKGSQKKALEEACEIAEEQQGEHLYHSKGYCRELWLDALGLPAVLPPPEETQHVRSAISAAQAQQQSERNR